MADFWSTVEGYAQVLSNPSQSSVLAGGAVGAFSAEINNLEKQASISLDKYGAYIPKPFQSIVNNWINPAKTHLNNLATSGGSSSGKILGFTYTQAIIIGMGAFVVFVALIARAVK